MRGKSMQEEAKLAASADQNSEEEDSPGDVGNDGSDRDAAKPHHRQSPPPASEGGAETHVQNVDHNH